MPTTNPSPFTTSDPETANVAANMSNMPSSDHYSFKIVLDGLTRRVAFLDGAPSFSSLCARLQSMFGVPSNNIGLTYVDVDGDEITLSSQAELLDFYATSVGSTPKFVLKDLSGWHRTVAAAQAAIMPQTSSSANRPVIVDRPPHISTIPIAPPNWDFLFVPRSDNAAVNATEQRSSSSTESPVYIDEHGDWEAEPVTYAHEPITFDNEPASPVPTEPEIYEAAPTSQVIYTYPPSPPPAMTGTLPESEATQANATTAQEKEDVISVSSRASSPEPRQTEHPDYSYSTDLYNYGYGAMPRATKPKKTDIDFLTGDSDIYESNTVPKLDKGKGKAPEYYTLPHKVTIEDEQDVDAPQAPTGESNDIKLESLSPTRFVVSIADLKEEADRIDSWRNTDGMPDLVSLSPSSEATALTSEDEDEDEDEKEDGEEREEADPPLPTFPSAPTNAPAQPTLVSELTDLFGGLSAALSAHPELSEGFRNLMRNAQSPAYWQNAAEDAARGEYGDRLKEVAEAGRKLGDAIAGLFGAVTASPPAPEAPVANPAPAEATQDEPAFATRDTVREPSFYMSRRARHVGWGNDLPPIPLPNDEPVPFAMPPFTRRTRRSGFERNPKPWPSVLGPSALDPPVYHHHGRHGPPPPPPPRAADPTGPHSRPGSPAPPPPPPQPHHHLGPHGRHHHFRPHHHAHGPPPPPIKTPPSNPPNLYDSLQTQTPEPPLPSVTTLPTIPKMNEWTPVKPLDSTNPPPAINNGLPRLHHGRRAGLMGDFRAATNNNAPNTRASGSPYPLRPDFPLRMEFEGQEGREGSRPRFHTRPPPPPPTFYGNDHWIRSTHPPAPLYVSHPKSYVPPYYMPPPPPMPAMPPMPPMPHMPHMPPMPMPYNYGGYGWGSSHTANNPRTDRTSGTGVWETASKLSANADIYRNNAPHVVDPYGIWPGYKVGNDSTENNNDAATSAQDTNAPVMPTRPLSPPNDNEAEDKDKDKEEQKAQEPISLLHRINSLPTSVPWKIDTNDLKRAHSTSSRLLGPRFHQSRPTRMGNTMASFRENAVAGPSGDGLVPRVKRHLTEMGFSQMSHSINLLRVINEAVAEVGDRNDESRENHEERVLSAVVDKVIASAAADDGQLPQMPGTW